MLIKYLLNSNDMSLSDLRHRQTEAERNVNRLRNCLPEKLETFCKMHLSFLLDLSGTKLEELFGDNSSRHIEPIKKKASTPFSKKKESSPQMGNRFLSQDEIAQIYQLIEFLQRPENIRTEGLFRKTGNMSRQRLLKEWVKQGADLHLDDGTFSPHDCATVLKSCISELPEPLLTEKHFEAHCQIVDMANNVPLDKDRSKVKDKQIKALQLLFLLIPRENAILLECLLDLLHKVSNVSENMMNSHSLGMVFAPSLICPKKLTPMEFHSMSESFTKAVSFLIESTPFLFQIPRELAVDVGNFWRDMEDPHNNVFTEEPVPQNTNDHVSIQKSKYGSATAVNTVVTFAERKSMDELQSSQDTQVALAQLYAHVQAMPNSAKKKKLLKQFNKANGYSSSKTKHTRSRTFGESLKKHIPLLNKHKQRNASSEEAESSCTGISWEIKKTINFDEKENMATCNKTPKKIIEEVKVKSFDNPAVHIVDLKASPQMAQDPKVPNIKNTTLLARKRHSDEDLNKDLPNVLMSSEKEIDYIFKVTPKKKVCPFTQQKPTAVVSPITKSSAKTPKSTQMAMVTPRGKTSMMLFKTPNQYRESNL
ncbi:hypothetical protein CHS0354_014064 [Potamilus streckersoni]|uniref:Rho-GAP domain-containing protein n=1 Tax=Potamilus streckersoni TaxID=2493646 RepID=A0AAE0W2U9_9BIVA|nr:hypothetical protein CHS0354_014064 [Potamilus streckersoni]